MEGVGGERDGRIVRERRGGREERKDKERE